MPAKRPPARQRGVGAVQLGEQEARMLADFGQHYGIQFRDAALLRLALTHRSYLHVSGQGPRDSNERLEFLGDSVLGLVTSEHLYRIHPTEHEGQLTKTKSLLVSKAILSRRALAMGLGRFVFMSHSEVESGGRQRLSILADAFESVVGAIYLDQGFEAARAFIERWLLRESGVIVADKRHTNYKSHLQEYVQSTYRTHPVYRIRSEIGPDHSKQFMVEVMVGRRMLGEGKGRNKKEAEQAAARNALEQVERGPISDRETKRVERAERAPRLERPGREERGGRDARPVVEEPRPRVLPDEPEPVTRMAETLPEPDDLEAGRRRRRGRRGGRGRRRSGETEFEAGGPASIPAESAAEVSPPPAGRPVAQARPETPRAETPRREPPARPPMEAPPREIGIRRREPEPPPRYELEPPPPAREEDENEEVGRPDSPQVDPYGWEPLPPPRELDEAHEAPQSRWTREEELEEEQVEKPPATHRPDFGSREAEDAEPEDEGDRPEGAAETSPPPGQPHWGRRPPRRRR